MNTLQMLDVSLRDGGHRNNFNFLDEHLENILPSIDNAGIEYIEIGYRNGSLSCHGNIGRAGLCHGDYLDQCVPLIKKSKIVVMVFSENVNRADLNELKQHNVSMIRICIPKNHLSKAGHVANMAQDLGMEVSLNIINMSQYSDNELDQVTGDALNFAPDVIYFADSNGSVLPHQVQDIYQRYTQQYDTPFGFHAHDNLGLAQANALAAINAGAQYIDASLGGMGKGIGNLKTEFFAAYLQAARLKHYDLESLLLASNYLRKTLGVGQEEIELTEFYRGIFDRNEAYK
jgi:4-hydroxy 2-oxovalerate aldolase